MTEQDPVLPVNPGDKSVYGGNLERGEAEPEEGVRGEMDPARSAPPEASSDSAEDPLRGDEAAGEDIDVAAALDATREQQQREDPMGGMGRPGTPNEPSPEGEYGDEAPEDARSDAQVLDADPQS